MVNIESRVSRGESWRKVPVALWVTEVMFGKKEFGVKCETKISDMRFPQDSNVLEVEWCWGSRTASSVIFPAWPINAGPTLRPTLRQRCVVHRVSGGLTVADGNQPNDRSDDNL